MKSVIRIINICIYLFLIQVYPFLHWHGHKHGDDIDIHLSIHFPDFSKEIHEPEHQSGSSEDHCHHHHEHDVRHGVGDWDYTVQLINFNYKLTRICLIDFDITTYKPPYFLLSPQNFPLKTPRYFFSSNYSHRAPPQLI